MVFEKKLRCGASVSLNQLGFMLRMPTIEATCILRQLMEEDKVKYNDLRRILIDLGKIYDRIPREVLWWVPERKKVTTRYISLEKDMYNSFVSSIRKVEGEF